MIEKFDKLPKTIKVFFYITISIVLSEALIELANIQQTFLIRISAQLVNVLIVFLQESVPAVRQRIK